MSKIHAPRKPIETPQKATVAGRVFKFSLKDVPSVDGKMWAQMKAAARTPNKDRRYPEIAEAPDASI